MKHLAVAVASAVLCALTGMQLAAAADLSFYKSAPLSTYSWTGFYIDGFVGGAVNSTNENVTGNTFSANVSAAPKGVVGGGGMGYDWDLGRPLVFGLFAEGALANIDGSGNLSAPKLPVTVSNATNYLLGIGGRLGWLIDSSTLLYVKGGFAGGGAHPNFSATVSQSIDDTSTGWLVGAGLEKRITANWSVRAEYEHYELGDRTLTINLGGNNIMTNTARYSIEIGKVGLAYRF